MNGKLTIKLNYNGVDKDYSVDISPKNIEKFTSDTFYILDAVLQEIVCVDKYKHSYDESDEEQKVAIDSIIEGLKNE